MEARVSLTGGMHFDVSLMESGYKLALDTAPGENGSVPGGRPMELVLAALAGCTAFDVITVLRKARQEVTDFQVSANGVRREESPRVFTEIRLEYLVRGHNISEDVVKRAIKLSEEKYCSVEAMLRSTVKIEASYKIVEES
jgi:putative redox protein